MKNNKFNFRYHPYFRHNNFKRILLLLRANFKSESDDEF